MSKEINYSTKLKISIPLNILHEAGEVTLTKTAANWLHQRYLGEFKTKLFASDEGLKLHGAKIIMYTVAQLEKITE